MIEQHARRAIERAFPTLTVCQIAFLGAGEDSAAFLVNGAWVFRFPNARRWRAPCGARSPCSRGWRPVCRWPSRASPTSGGRRPPGCCSPATVTSPASRSRARFAALGPADQERVLGTLAAVLRGLHAFPVPEATALGVEPLDTRAWVAACWARGRRAARRLLAPGAAAALARLIDDFLADAQPFASTPCLLYADFAPEHLLYEPAAKTITGLIDWGDLAIGDPDFDWLYLYQDHGEAFVQRLLAYYPHPAPARLLAKLRVFNACDYLRTLAAARWQPLLGRRCARPWRRSAHCCVRNRLSARRSAATRCYNAGTRRGRGEGSHGGGVRLPRVSRDARVVARASERSDSASSGRPSAWAIRHRPHRRRCQH